MAFNFFKLRRQIAFITSCPPTIAPTGPPRYHGKVSSSVHVNRVRKLSSSGSSVNTPVPVTIPVWRTPMAAFGAHSVMVISSTNLMGPTFVSQKNSVPTPRVCSDLNRIATASAIQSMCRSIGSTTCHTRSTEALRSIDTSIISLPMTLCATRLLLFLVRQC